ncbi:cutinase family protein [Rhodococcus fascians]|nr:cutinase family protein [Rhodococcus fascians]
MITVFALAFVMLVAAVALPSKFQPTASAASEFDCSTDVLFVGARGSGESATSDDGLGSIVRKTRDVLKIRLDGLGRTMSTVAVTDGYPAEAVTVLTGTASPPTLPNPVKFLGGMQSGVDATRDLLWRWALDPACMKQRLVLAGFSQGAMVMHRVARSIEGFNGLGLQNRIDGVILVADGDRKGDDPNVRHIGNAPIDNGGGIARVYPPAGGSDLGGFSWDWKDRIASICKAGDPVCSFIGTSLQSYRGNGVTIHNSYGTSNWLATAVNWIKFDRFPPDKPVFDINTTTVNARVSIAVNHKLVATSGDRCVVNWYLNNGAAMPAGMQLTKAGTVRGTPTASGQSTVPVKAVADCPTGRKDPSAVIELAINSKPAPTYGTNCRAGTPTEYTMPPITVDEEYKLDWVLPFFINCNSRNRADLREPEGWQTPFDLSIAQWWRNDQPSAIGTTPDGVQVVYKVTMYSDQARPNNDTRPTEFAWKFGQRWLNADGSYSEQIFTATAKVIYPS